MFRHPIVVIDTETTGLPQHDGARPIEIAAVVVTTDGKIAERYSSLVRSHDEPEPPDWARRALEITGIAWDDVLTAPSVSEVLAGLDAMFERPKTCWVTAYNCGFDKEMMRRIGWGTGKRWCSDIMLKAMLPWMAEARALKPSNPMHWQFNPELPWLFPPLCPKAGRLSVAEFFGVELPGGAAHRALFDAEVAALVMVEIQKRALQRELEEEGVG